MKTIGFFGDSFCCIESNKHSETNNYETYIRLIKKHYNCEIVNLGIAGSGVWDLYLNQIKPFIESNTIPDVSVFIYSVPGRLFNREVRNLNKPYLSIREITEHSLPHWEAAKLYYEYLYDEEKEVTEWIAILQYLNNNVFTNWPKDKKIIHMWATAGYNYYNTSNNSDEYIIDDIQYAVDWNSGVEVRPPLMYLSKVHIWPTLEIPNHLGNKENNEALAKIIIDIIDNYKPNTIYQYAE